MMRRIIANVVFKRLFFHRFVLKFFKDNKNLNVLDAISSTCQNWKTIIQQVFFINARSSSCQKDQKPSVAKQSQGLQPQC